jgi:hypothetical protein
MLQAADVVITVHNSTDFDRADEPVRLGVPLPADTAQTVAMTDASGRSVPCQKSGLAAGSKRRVGWVALDFPATVSARSTATYHLHAGKAAQTARTPLAISENADTVTIVTGPAKFAIAKNRLTGVAAAWLDVDRDGDFTENERLLAGEHAGPFIVNDRGIQYSGAHAQRVNATVEGGPLRATVTVTGWLASPKGLFTRAGLYFTAYAGKAYLDITYTMTLAHPPGTALPELRYEVPPIRAERYTDGLSFLRYRLSRRAWHEISDWGWRFPLRIKHARGTLGGHGPVSGPANQVQYVDDQFVVHRGEGSDPEDEIGRGEQAPGWAEVRGDAAGATVIVRDFWQAFPKRLRLTSDAIEVGFWPDALPPLSVPIGIATTHQMRLVLHRNDADPDREARCFASPLIARLSAEQYCAAGVLGSTAMLTASTSGCTLGESKLAAQAESTMNLRDARRMYGLTDYGDIGYTNNQRDTLQDFIVQFARTADPNLLTFARPLARHYADVDIRHDHSEPRLVGGGILPDKEDYQIYTSPHTALCVSPSYSYPQGLANYALITGDSRLLSVAEALGGYLIRAMDADGGFHVDARPDAQQWIADSGAALTGLCALYDITGKSEYLEAARKAADYLAGTQNPDGSWYAQSPGRLDVLAGFERTDDPRTTNIFSDKGGLSQSIVLEGMAAYDCIASDANTRQAILKGVGFMLNHSRVPERDRFSNSTWRGNPVRYAETHLAWYQNEPAYSVECSARMLEALAYAHEMTGEIAYMKEAARVYQRLLAEGPVKVGSVQPWQETLEKVEFGPAKHYPAFFKALKQLGWPEPAPPASK